MVFCSISDRAAFRQAASDLLPQRAGQPVRAWVHMSLAELLAMEGSSALLETWSGCASGWTTSAAAGRAALAYRAG